MLSSRRSKTRAGFADPCELLRRFREAYRKCRKCGGQQVPSDEEGQRIRHQRRPDLELEQERGDGGARLRHRCDKCVSRISAVQRLGSHDLPVVHPVNRAASVEDAVGSADHGAGVAQHAPRENGAALVSRRIPPFRRRPHSGAAPHFLSVGRAGSRSLGAIRNAHCAGTHTDPGYPTASKESWTFRFISEENLRGHASALDD